MSNLVLTDVPDALLHQLQQRASVHRRTVAEEAKSILHEAVADETGSSWASVDSIHQRMSVSGRAFSDSAELLREDRDR